MSCKTIAGVAAAAGTLLAACAIPGLAATLEDVLADDRLRCGINPGLPGFSFIDDKGRWSGFEAAYCRALAAAVLGDPDKVSFVTLTGKTRFPALASGEVHVLSRNTTWTFSRDVDLGFTFVGINYYDGQGFLGRKSLGVKGATELDGASICIQTGTTTELNLADFFRLNKIEYEPVPIETNAEARTAYEAERCDSLHDGHLGSGGDEIDLRRPGRPRDLPGRHLEGAAGAAGAPGRRSLGGHCALGVEQR